MIHVSLISYKLYCIKLEKIYLLAIIIFYFEKKYVRKSFSA